MGESVVPDFCLVESGDEAEKAVRILSRAEALAVDLEADTLHHYGETLCLIQVSDGEHIFLFDALRLADLSGLTRVLADTRIEKVFHGADYDLHLIRRNLKVVCAPLFDTEIAGRFLGVKRSGLAELLSFRLGVRVDKSCQKQDWTKRPLPPKMREYAAADVRYLLRLAETMKEDLRRLGRLEWVKEECAVLASTERRDGEKGPLFRSFKGAGILGRRDLAVLEGVLKVRDDLAKERNLPPFRVLQPDVIREIVREKPRDEQRCREIAGLSRRSSYLCRKVCEAVNTALALPDERLPVYPRRDARRKQTASRWYESDVEALREWRDRKARELGVDGSIVCTAALIRRIAERRPRALGDLEAIEGLRRWQKKEFGREICALFQKARH